MESNIAIDVKNVSKVYKIYNKPVDRLKETLLFGHKKYYREFYALNKINFQIKKGECIGIIGRNGAGKSTLLKIITGVLHPSSGSVNVNGKISSLLELGAGFNPEFTGIENIYLNGSVMGFSKEEMNSKLQEILNFADIGNFAYQPVKTYSSGMYVRLAFSVAINVNPDVLIIDEALAVGDAKFQLKCFKRLERIKSSGVTILFVSHAIDQVRDFCNRGVVMNAGQIIFDGDSKKAAVKYFDLIFPKEDQNESEDEKNEINDKIESDSHKVLTLFPEKSERKSIFGCGGAQIEWVKIYGMNGKNIFKGGERVRIIVKYKWDQKYILAKQNENGLDGNVGLGIAFADNKGNYVFGCNNFDAGLFVDFKKSEKTILEVELVMPYLKSGIYFLTMAIACGKQEHHIQLRWYDYFEQFECISCKKNVYGFIALNYTMKKYEGIKNE